MRLFRPYPSSSLSRYSQTMKNTKEFEEGKKILHRLSYNDSTMKTWKFQLTRLEARLQALIEGNAARIFPNGKPQNDLATRLVSAMQAGVQTGPDGEILAPNLYVLQVSPERVEALSREYILLDGLMQIVSETGNEAGWEFPSPPVIRVRALEGLASHEIRISAQNSLAHLPQTSDLSIEGLLESGELPKNAFLIVDGTRIFNLDRTAINIGRRPDNHLLIDDPRVSRVHAQIRAVRGRYVIFDLDSTGGTFVNGERIRQCPLSPGDVISLSSLPLVYGQDDDLSMGSTQDIPVDQGSWDEAPAEHEKKD